MSDLPRVDGPPIPVQDRIQTQDLVTYFSDWLATVRSKQTSGEINREEEDKIIARSMAALYRNKERMKKKAYTDALTGLYNRRYFNEALQKIGGENVGVLILDIDHFKKVNDTHGHKAGDSVLAQVALTLTTGLRQGREEEAENDIIARYGGEEMVVILRNMSDQKKMLDIAKKLRMSVGGTPMSVSIGGTKTEIPITVSIGAGLISPGENAALKVHQIDKQALYGAKEAGRNRTVILGETING